MTTARATTPAVHIFPHRQLQATDQASMVTSSDGKSPKLAFRTKPKSFAHQQSRLGKYIHSGRSHSKDLDHMGRKTESLDKRLGAVRQGADLSPAQTSATIGFTLSQFRGFRRAVDGRTGGPEVDTVRFEPHEVRTEEEVKRAVTWGI